VYLLNPFEVDDRYDADAQIDVPGNIDVASLYGPMQPFIEQHVGAFRQILPFSEGARIRTETLGFVQIVYIVTALTAAGFAIYPKQFFQLGEQVGFRAEVAEMVVTCQR
jgi:hypothetical protein